MSSFRLMDRLARAVKTLAGVFSKQYRESGAGHAETDRSTVIYDNDPVVNAVSGAMSYLDLLAMIHREFAPRLYLEIGVRNGASLRLSGCASIGIDPEPQLARPLSKAATLYHRTSDDFFALDAANAIRNKIDFAFIDGMHKFEYALRDFINIERYSASTSLVVIDDVLPNHPAQARRMRHSRVWTGDVWKLLVCLRIFRTDLILMPVNTSPTGSLLIAGLDPSKQELLEKYDSILRRFVTEPDETPPAEVLRRDTAIQPDDARLMELLHLLKSCREDFSGDQGLRERLAVFAKRLIASS
jgi:hypothetical protein